jgi:hypothetical protein
MPNSLKLIGQVVGIAVVSLLRKIGQLINIHGDCCSRVIYE